MSDTKRKVLATIRDVFSKAAVKEEFAELEEKPKKAAKKATLSDIVSDVISKKE